MATTKVIPIKPLTSWSFSRYDTYRQCPLKAKLKFIDKLKEPTNDAMTRGDQIHKMAEQYIKGTLEKLPAELKAFKKLFTELRKEYGQRSESMVVEDTWAFTRVWTETAWNDWNGCWVRIKLDCARYDPADEAYETLVPYDWKTGKFRPEKNEEYLEQLELYALAALLLHDHVKRVTPFLVYVDLGRVYPAGTKDEPVMVYTRDDIPRLKKAWEQRVKAMLSDTVFAPRPNNFCNWCHFRAENGGPCKY